MKRKQTLQFLTPLDHWLLKNQPLIWRTRIHYVLFYSLLAHVIVFAIYHLYLMTIDSMPDKGDMAFFRIGMIALGCFSIMAWGYRSLKIPIKSNRWTSFLLTALLYWLGIAAICSNVWMTSKALENKLAGLEYYPPITEYKNVSVQFRVDDRRKTHSWKSNPELTMDEEFKERYGMTYKEYNAFSDKLKTINKAKENKGWFTVSYGFGALYWVLLIGIIVLPMIALLLSMIGLQTAILLAFAQFLTFIGLYSFNLFEYDKYYIYFSLFLCGLVTIVRINHKVLHGLLLYTASMIPIAMMLYIDVGIGQTPFSGSSVSIDLMYSMLSAICVSSISYLYFRTINQPQVA